MIPAAVAAIAVGVMALAAPAFARDASPAPAAKVAQDERAFGQSSLVNINNMSYWFVRDGNSANNPANGNSGVTFPRSTDQVIYQDGMIWGGIVNDGDAQTLRVGGQTYAVGTVPGLIVGNGVGEAPADPSVRIYRIRKDYRFADLKLVSTVVEKKVEGFLRQSKGADEMIEEEGGGGGSGNLTGGTAGAGGGGAGGQCCLCLRL